jgi:hypothetical protein
MKVPGMDSLIGKSAKAVNRRQAPGVNPHQKHNSQGAARYGTKWNTADCGADEAAHGLAFSRLMMEQEKRNTNGT